MPKVLNRTDGDRLFRPSLHNPSFFFTLYTTLHNSTQPYLLVFQPARTYIHDRYLFHTYSNDRYSLGPEPDGNLSGIVYLA
uniref:Uncharacterized protein n=1 Tax=Picea glauca TaxID=3330 RepID=A0A101LUK6_PICGL|nr:hypothetical protein ABT39_MTgene2462 [Picea glauca]QHR88531.1 hypothetical protein Q903MT_gene2545 [Picea sitchensis]